MKIKLSLLILFLLFHATFINIYYIDSYNLITYLILILCGGYLLLNVKCIDKKFKKINILLSIFLCLICLSSLINKNIQGIIFSIKILEMFLMGEIIESKSEGKNAINVLFYLLCFYILINDISLLISGPLLKYGYNEYYMLGNKFTIGLLHIELILLYLIKCTNSKPKFIKNIIKALLILLSILISIKVECSTTIICNVMLILLLLTTKKTKEKLFNPKVLITFLLICSFILIFFSEILQIKVVEYIIVDILNKDITLTGRMNIYSNISSLIQKKLIFGYGQGSSYEILMPLLNAPNTQNGLIEFIFSYGIISTIVMLILVYNVIKQNCKKLELFPLLCFLYICFLISSVEISIGLNLFIFMALIIMCSNMKLKESLNNPKKEGV